MTDSNDSDVLRPLGRGGLTVQHHAYGVAALGNLYRPVEPEFAFDALEAAWEAGVRYFDTAPHYGLGLAEERLGRALARRPRDEFVVSTKVGRILVPTDAETALLDDEDFAVKKTHTRVHDYSRDGVLRSIEDSLERTGLDRFDIVLVHDPDDFYIDAMEETFPALEELRAAGVITSYGAGMNQSPMLADFVRNTDLDVVMVAGRFTLLEQPALADLLPVALDRGVSVIAAGVFNSGLLATDRPAAGAKLNYSDAGPEVIARVNHLADLCESFGVSLAAAAAQYPLRHPAVSTVCLGARSRAQVTRNAELFDVDIPEALWTSLAQEEFIHA